MAIMGNDLGQQLDGSNANDQIFGLGGNDLLLGNDGNDYLSGDEGNDELRGGNGNDTLEGGNGSDRTIGGAGLDTFVINVENSAAGNEITDFQLGIDRIDISKLRIADFASIQTLLGDAGGNDSGFGFYRNDAWLSTVMLGVSQDDWVAADFIFSTVVNNDTQVGGSLKDYLFGGLGNDLLVGGSGDDRLFGEGGDDRLYGNTAAAPDGTDDGIDLLYGGSGNDLLFGGGQGDQLFGGDGNDRLDGGTGSDFMTGGAGSDVYVMRAENKFQSDSITDFDVTEDKLDVSALGISDFDTIKSLSSVSTVGNLVIIYHVFDSNNLMFFNGILPGSLSIGNIILATSIGNDIRTGNTQDNDLFGGFGNDKLSGGQGDDRLFGEQGDDQLFGDDSADSDGSDSDGKDLLYGGAGNDQLLGGGGNDALAGGLDNDTLSGGADSDTLDGGSGLDTSSYLASAAAVAIRLWNNTAAGGDADGDTLIGIENLIGSKLGNDILIGNALANVLDGSGGADRMNGREGSDTYFVDNIGDSISDRSGIDTVNSTISYTLGAKLENLKLLGNGALNGKGNELNNSLTGNGGNNTLNGLDGIDTVSYANAAAAVTVNLSISTAQNTIGAGFDTLLEFENLSGSGFSDRLIGDSNANIMTGGAGGDLLTGGAGGDSFVFNSKAGSDTITDFVSASDKLLFSQTALRIGDGDALLEGGVVKTGGSGGFANSAEVVIMQQTIAGLIDTVSAAKIIGAATTAYTVGKTILFAVDNGISSGLFLFTAANNDALVSTDELIQLGIIGNTATTTLADYGFIP